MKTFFDIIVLTLPLLIINCQSEADGISITGLNSFQGGNLILFDDFDQIYLYEDGVAINQASIHGDFLILNVSYSGGCKVHEFQLFAWKGLSKSDPPQAEIFLSHNGNGDMCEAYLTKEITFNLLELKQYIWDNFSYAGPVYLNIYAPKAIDAYNPKLIFNI